MPKRVVQTGRSGWYLRVLREGAIESGMPIMLKARHHSQWTITNIASAMYDNKVDPEVVATLAELPELAADWRAEFVRKATRKR